jgi:hypothetical protein
MTPLAKSPWLPLVSCIDILLIYSSLTYRQTFGTRWIFTSALLSRVYLHFGHTSTLLQSPAPSTMSKARQALMAANTPAHLVPLVLARPMSLGRRPLIGSHHHPHCSLWGTYQNHRHMIRILNY